MRGTSLGLTSIWLGTNLKEEAGFSPREMDSSLGMDGGFAYWKPKIRSKGEGSEIPACFCVVFHKAYLKVNRWCCWRSLVHSLALTRG